MTIDWTLVTDWGWMSPSAGMLQQSVVSALPIGGTILAVGIAWKLFKKFTK